MFENVFQLIYLTSPSLADVASCCCCCCWHSTFVFAHSFTLTTIQQQEHCFGVIASYFERRGTKCQTISVAQTLSEICHSLESLSPSFPSCSATLPENNVNITPKPTSPTALPPVDNNVTVRKKKILSARRKYLTYLFFLTRLKTTCSHISFVAFFLRVTCIYSTETRGGASDTT